MNNTNQNVASPQELKERAVGLSKDAGQTIGASLNEVGSSGMSAAGQKLEQLATLVESRGEMVVQDERLPVGPEHVEVTSRSIRKTADYLQKSSPASLAQDTEEAMKNHPYRTLAVGLAAGWVIGKLLSGD